MINLVDMNEEKYDAWELKMSVAYGINVLHELQRYCIWLVDDD